MLRERAPQALRLPGAGERQREAALAAQIAASAGAPPEQAADTEALVKDMNRLLSSVKQRQFEVYRHPEASEQRGCIKSGLFTASCCSGN